MHRLKVFLNSNSAISRTSCLFKDLKTSERDHKMRCKVHILLPLPHLLHGSFCVEKGWELNEFESQKASKTRILSEAKRDATPLWSSTLKLRKGKQKPWPQKLTSNKYGLPPPNPQKKKKTYSRVQPIVVPWLLLSQFIYIYI